MESRENPLFGRKIFFICPSYIMEKYLIESLHKNEYEIYVLKDFRRAKGLLSKFPGGFNRVEKKEKFINNIMAILDLNGAKGRRKYLRLDTRGVRDVSGYMTSEGKSYGLCLQMEALLEAIPRDNDSYSQPDEYSKLQAVHDRSYDELLPLDAPELLSTYTGNLDDDIL